MKLKQRTNKRRMMMMMDQEDEENRQDNDQDELGEFDVCDLFLRDWNPVEFNAVAGIKKEVFAYLWKKYNRQVKPTSPITKPAYARIIVSWCCRFCRIVFYIILLLAFGLLCDQSTVPDFLVL
jgi:hypothetical protein